MSVKRNFKTLKNKFKNEGLAGNTVDTTLTSLTDD